MSKALKAQIKELRATRQMHGDWYLQRYPDVATLGMDPAEHFLRYGALLRRDPGKGFDTGFYLDSNPEVAAAGLNPLLHYARQGQAAGRPRRAPDPLRQAAAEIDRLRNKLLSLGFTEQPLADLAGLAATGETSLVRALAHRELALWHMRDKTPAGWRIALDHIARARAATDDGAIRTRLATVELLCHHFLGQQAEGRAAFAAAGARGEIGPDGLLAWVNFQPSPGMRRIWINRVLARFGIAPVGLLPDDGRPAYDRLTAGRPLPRIETGPKVTVLLAAYAAADTIGTALRSLQEQSWGNLEILVIDDTSPDDTCAVVEAFAAADSRIRLIRMEENGGAYVARNRGLDQASGDYVTIHDADDWSHPAKIETQVRFMEATPEAMGCTSQQARAYSDLGFTRWTGQGQFIIPNTSSFLFRRRPMRDELGYWDTVRFSADNELVRRMQFLWGRQAVQHLATGPLSFQRDSDSSIVADEVLGVNGFMFGARRAYREAQGHHRLTATSLKYGADSSRRPFPAPALMRPERARLTRDRHLPVILGSDFRMHGGSVASCVEDMRAARALGLPLGIFEMFRYDLPPLSPKEMLPEVRAELGGGIECLVFGEEVSCDLLLLRYPPILQHRQRYLPQIRAREIKVIVNQPPMSDYTSEGVMRYDLARCADTLRHHFGRDASWHPIGPLVRQALVAHHAGELAAVDLAPEDWVNIIDIRGWDRGPRRRGPGDRLRIGRHSRDSAMKWPATAAEILAAYPEAEDVEVHVLGGAEVPRALIGHLPANWTVTRYGSRAPRDFLAEIDVFVYFAHPDWIESFGRTIIEAMATGVPAILPEIYRPLFEDAALYATPETALALARRLHADPAGYAAQAAKARAYVEDRFSYAMHAARLRRAGVML